MRMVSCVGTRKGTLQKGKYSIFLVPSWQHTHALPTSGVCCHEATRKGKLRKGKYSVFHFCCIAGQWPHLNLCSSPPFCVCLPHVGIVSTVAFALAEQSRTGQREITLMQLASLKMFCFGIKPPKPNIFKEGVPRKKIFLNVSSYKYCSCLLLK